MAEIVLPLIGLGALYVISNKNNKQENFNNNKQSKLAENLPNTHIHNINYPSNSFLETTYPINNTSENRIREYLNPNQTTDKYFNNTGSLEVRLDSVSHQNPLINSSSGIDSLTGNKISSDKFSHNNMVPFFGSNVKGAQVNHSLSNILDNLQGSATNQIKKVEQSPLFKPDDNVQYNYGAPNQTDFFRSRELPSTKISNVLPWAQEKVGPGIGLGYTTAGSGGFNSGMLDREAWQAQTVDEMRVKTNPKISYTLDSHQGPAQSKVQNRGDLGEFEKHGPTTDFALGPQYWLTGTGATLAPTSIPEQMVHDGNRITTTSEYYGSSGTGGGDSKVSYIKGQFEASQKPEFVNSEFNPVSAIGRGVASSRDYGMDGYNIPKNNRLVDSESRNNGVMGGINGTFKAVMAPLMDALRPSRKENIINNANLSGSVRASVPSLPLTNPNNRLPTTTKETTVDKIGLNYLNVSHMSNNQSGGYENTDIQIKDQERNIGDSSTRGYIGGTAVTRNEPDRYEYTNQHNNVNKTYESWPMQGSAAIFNPQTNFTMDRKDSDRVNKRLQSGDFIQQQMPASVATNIPSLDSYGKINMPQQYNQQLNADRMNPDILSAFKSNPYAQSLNSY